MLSPTFSRIVPGDETSNWVKVFFDRSAGV